MVTGIHSHRTVSLEDLAEARAGNARKPPTTHCRCEAGAAILMKRQRVTDPMLDHMGRRPQVALLGLRLSPLDNGQFHWGKYCKGRVLAKLKQLPRSLIGIRATTVPHQKLGLARLEDVSKLVPSGQIDYVVGEQRVALPLPYQNPSPPRRILAGIVSTLNNTSKIVTVRLDQDGFIELFNGHE